LNDFILVDIQINKNKSADGINGGGGDESSFVNVKIPYMDMSYGGGGGGGDNDDADDVSLIKVNWLNAIKSNNDIQIRVYTNRPHIEQAPSILNKIESYLINGKLSSTSVACLIKLYKEEWLK
jgi:hypothetical protein